MDDIFVYPYSALKRIFSQILEQNVSAQTWLWLNEKTDAAMPVTGFYAAFVMVPRKTGKQPVNISPEQHTAIQQLRQGLDIREWQADRLSRAWLLMHIDAGNKEDYIGTIENLFQAAEMNELIALYSSLPLLAYPESWRGRCAEGIRNNIGDVLTAIMCNNPYPAEQLNQDAWNQLVLKAFFTDKPIDKIYGLDERRNQKLAATLIDYAHERWAAHRTVNPQLWRCVAPFINNEILPDIEKAAGSENELEREAVALACASSNFAPCKKLIPEYLHKSISSGRLTWNVLAEKNKEHVLQ